MAKRESGIITELDWCTKVLLSGQPKRKEIVQDVINGVECYHPHGINQPDKNWLKPSAEGKKIMSHLKDHTLVGFIPNVYYIKASGNKDDLKAMYCHPFSMFTLLLAHKEWPMLTIINPMLSFNESRVSKIDGNQGLSELSNIQGIMG